ncbi:hypothetical protein D1F64_02160 [Breoghania sp. L-A4]|nr:hypothetical protein D1F64_02160 [Breoghania sp. L-A4]
MYAEGQVMDIFIHLGMPKTGSTALQTVLRNNHAALGSAGLHYVPDFRDIAASIRKTPLPPAQEKTQRRRGRSRPFCNPQAAAADHRCFPKRPPISSRVVSSGILP